MYACYRVNLGGHIYWSWAYSYKQAKLNVKYRLHKKRIHDIFIKKMIEANNNE